MIGWLLEWLLQCLKLYRNRLKICKTSINNLSNMVQKSIRIGPQSCLGGVLGHLGPKMAPRWPQDGPKSPQNLENRFLGPPLGGHFGSQNRSKSVSRAIRKVIVFMIDLKIDFGIDLLPTWSHLVVQNPPKMVPSWLQNPCKLEC